jgi:hypothetical protein
MNWTITVKPMGQGFSDTWFWQCVPEQESSTARIFSGHAYGTRYNAQCAAKNRLAYLFPGDVGQVEGQVRQ